MEVLANGQRLVFGIVREGQRDFNLIIQAWRFFEVYKMRHPHR